MMQEQVRQPNVKSFITSRKEQKRFVKFAIVGTIGMLVDMAVFRCCFWD